MPGNGVWNETDYTVTFDAGDVLPGEALSFGIDVVVDEAAAAGGEILNTAVVDYSSLPGDTPGEFEVTNGSQSDAIVRIASDAPVVSKTAPVSNFDQNRIFDYTITVEIPANSTYETL